MSKHTVLRKTTNSGHPTKYVFRTESHPDMDDAVIIQKICLVPMKTYVLDKYVFNSFNLLKQFKSMALIEQVFSMKIDTFKELNEILKDYE